MLSAEGSDLLKRAAASKQDIFVFIATDGGFHFEGWIAKDCEKSVLLQNFTVHFPSGTVKTANGTTVIEKEKIVAVWVSEKTLAKLEGKENS